MSDLGIAAIAVAVGASARLIGDPLLAVLRQVQKPQPARAVTRAAGVAPPGTQRTEAPAPQPDGTVLVPAQRRAHGQFARADGGNKVTDATRDGSGT